MARVAKILQILKPTDCTNCHRKDLRWIQYEDANGKSHYGMVPANSINVQAKTADTSEADHPLTVGGCNLRQLKAQKGETVTVEKEVVKEIVREVQVGGTVDLTEVNTKLADHESRITQLDAFVPTLEKRITDLTPAIEAIGDYMTTEVATMRTEIQNFSKARPIEIRVLDAKGKVAQTVDVGRQHVNFANLVTMVQACARVGGIVFMVGEAGSWKSSALEHLSKAMNLRYMPHVCGEDMSATDVFGFIDANGKPVDPWGFRDFYENGGITFLDEIGNASASGLTSMNSLTSNSLANFAGGVQVRKHKDALYLAADNTYGRGQDALYISRQQLDAATLSRFVYLPWQTDWGLVSDSLGLAPIRDDFDHFPAPGKPRDLKSPEVQAWGQYVKGVYDAVQKIGIRAVISSRAIINGRELLLSGVDRKLVEFSTIWGHMSEQDAKSVQAELSGNA